MRKRLHRGNSDEDRSDLDLEMTVPLCTYHIY